MVMTMNNGYKPTDGDSYNNNDDKNDDINDDTIIMESETKLNMTG